jgi:hypothetical protein
MEESFEQAEQMSQQEPYSWPEDRYYQQVKDITRSWQSSRQAVWELFQALHAHHSLVQTRYEAVVMAMTSGEDLTPLLYEYHEAVTEHRSLVRRFRQAMQQHQQEMKDNLHRRIQELP